jgi:hypothetical protein
MLLRRWFLLLVLPVVFCAGPASARSDHENPTFNPLILTEGFWNAHPDLKYRTKGVQAYDQGRHEDALRFFMRAAFYADKPSQAMIAEMIANGEGHAKDPVLAYAWMDIAAERGYQLFLQQRERYWLMLDAAGRTRAIAEGHDLHAVYGDAAAKPRIAKLLRRELAGITGSRTGATGALAVVVRAPGGGSRTIAGSQLFDPKYWNPREYQQWQDAIWTRPRIGTVDVGAVETVVGAAAIPESRIPAGAPQENATAPDVPDETTP